MVSEMNVKIKRQLFNPPFVIQVGDEHVPARTAMLDSSSVVARIEGRGIYRIDITDVGFWFVEREARLYEAGSVLPKIRGGIFERAVLAFARSCGRHCGAVADEFQNIQDLLLKRGG